MRRTRLQEVGLEVAALRGGHVRMYADDDGTGFLAGGSAIKWPEAEVSLGPRRFFLLDGHWYEIDANYLQTHRAQVERLLDAAPSLDLPPWDTTWAERDYNDWVPLNRAGYVCLDRRGTRDRLHQHSGVKVCDLLAPGDELVHVKRAHGSAPLSHLFSQGLVAAEALLSSSDLRARFASEVRKRGRGRTVATDFTPKKIVFAILLKDGELLTPDTLFPFPGDAGTHSKDPRTPRSRGGSDRHRRHAEVSHGRSSKLPTGPDQSFLEHDAANSGQPDAGLPRIASSALMLRGSRR